jgi:hypothetical protein
MSLDKAFEDLVDSIRDAQKQIADGITINAARHWMDFRDIKVIGKFDKEEGENGLEAIRDLFKRTAIDTAYNQERSNADAIAKDTQALKLMGDFLAGSERDWRMRQRSRVRMFVHGACIARSNGDKAGPLQRNTIHWLTRVLSEDGS